MAPNKCILKLLWEHLDEILSSRFPSKPLMAPKESIQKLPQELLDEILKPLFLSDHISLRLTCRNLYFRSPPLPDLHNELINSNTQEAMILAKTLERDMAPEYCACGRCHRLHPIRYFEHTELRKRDGWDRRCLGSKLFFILDPTEDGTAATSFRAMKEVREELQKLTPPELKVSDTNDLLAWAAYEEEVQGRFPRHHQEHEVRGLRLYF